LNSLPTSLVHAERASQESTTGGGPAEQKEGGKKGGEFNTRQSSAQIPQTRKYEEKKGKKKRRKDPLHLISQFKKEEKTKNHSYNHSGTDRKGIAKGKFALREPEMNQGKEKIFFL